MEHKAEHKKSNDLQAANAPAQKKPKAAPLEDNRPNSVAQLKPNKTGLPDNLKSGIENLSGYAMDDVKVHYNSAKPAQLNAHAYAQGTEIHLASGQEKHLPHEAWHVVQQKQGRVQPTMQMKGKVNINDDSSLEKEADVIGSKAIQMKGNKNILKKLSRHTSSSNNIQRMRLGTPKSKLIKRLQLKSIEDILMEDYKRIESVYLMSLNHIKDIKPQLDDSDFKEVDSIESSLNFKFEKATEEYHKIMGFASKGRTRSGSKGRVIFEKKLKFLRLSINKDYYKLTSLFPLHSGGFGAKGRAHNMDVGINPKNVPNGAVQDNHFLEGITLNGVQSNANVYKSSKTVANESTGPIVVAGNKNPQPIQKDYLNKLVKLPSVNHPQYATFNKTPAGKDRGDGQYANMQNTNAAGYAWLMNIPLGGQRWEWLHIRGAGLGGYTNSTNLVTGTRDANTHMIPFESNIRTLATLVGNNINSYKRLDVEWNVAGSIASHAYNNISIGWELVGSDDKIEASGRANFNPLHTGSNISKAEVDALENALKEVREGLKTDN